MSSTSDIKAKFKKVKGTVGKKVGAEQNAGSGGRVQRYQKGRIYWHRNTGAHEVHGGILKKYLTENEVRRSANGRADAADTCCIGDAQQ